VHHYLAGLVDKGWFSITLATLLTGGYVAFLLRVEKKEFQKLPVIGKYL
jgi:hypothetical protein